MTGPAANPEPAPLWPLSLPRLPQHHETVARLQEHLGDHPQSADAWFRLGTALSAADRFVEATAALESALTLSPYNAGAECAYALALFGAGAHERAASVAEDVIERTPGHGWALHLLGSVRFRQNRIAEAEALWTAAVHVLDDPIDCLENLAVARRQLGDDEGERRCWQRIAQLRPDNPIAAHMFSAMGLAPVRPRADDAYVTQLFDRFAPHFDRVLGLLQYTVPGVAEAWMDTQFGPPRGTLRVLDVGCGTGLVGERVRPWAAHLVGADLSRKMLEIAAERRVYHILYCVELVEFLERISSGDTTRPNEPTGFDCVIAADVLCYFGDLTRFLAAAVSVLGPGGRLAFSTEDAAEAEAPDGFVLRPHGRYAHTRAYIESLLPEGVQASFATIVPRYELTVAVPGFWVIVEAASPSLAGVSGTGR